MCVVEVLRKYCEFIVEDKGMQRAIAAICMTADMADIGDAREDAPLFRTARGALRSAVAHVPGQMSS